MDLIDSTLSRDVTCEQPCLLVKLSRMRLVMWQPVDVAPLAKVHMTVMLPLILHSTTALEDWRPVLYVLNDINFYINFILSHAQNIMKCAKVVVTSYLTASGIQRPLPTGVRRLVSQRIWSGSRMMSTGPFSLAQLFRFFKNPADLFRVSCSSSVSIETSSTR